MFKPLLKRLLLPWHLWRVLKLQRRRKRTARVFNDAQLKLYHQLLPGDFLHYGYFDDAGIHPLDMSIRMIYQAQERYGTKLLEWVQNTQKPVLDVGCGMGGLLRLMNEKGWNATGLTPDINQAKHIGQKYPNKLLHCRFEDLDASSYNNTFGTVITSESLQYLNLDIALPLIQKLLMPGGTWVACDYFKTNGQGEKSGHNWSLFTSKLQENGFAIRRSEDITPHILPTIAYVHHWASAIGVPVLQFLEDKFRTKAPGFYYAAAESLPLIKSKINKTIDTINPELFAQNKQYLLLEIVRSE